MFATHGDEVCADLPAVQVNLNPTSDENASQSNVDAPRARVTLTSLVSCCILAGATLWAFWPTLEELVRAWSTQPDYSHGFIVPIAAILLCWLRRDTFPSSAVSWSPWGLLLLCAAAALRVVSGLWFIESLDGWALVLWIGGCVWLLGGTSVARWSAPVIAFLLFAIPLPFRLEHSLSQPLQHIATLGSVWTLQTLGQPAFAEGNTIVLGTHHLEVERACAGLRIFMGVVGIAYAWSLITSGAWLRRGLLLASSLVVAIVANIGRIVVTALCFQYGSEAFGQHIAHDVAGWFMIPVALLLVAMVSWYLSKLFVETRALEMQDVMRSQRG